MRRTGDLRVNKGKKIKIRSAVRIQTHWRIRLARRELERRRAVWLKSKAATSISKNIRRILAARKTLKIQLEQSYFLKVSFVEASGLHAADVSTSDPYVLALGESLEIYYYKYPFEDALNFLFSAFL
jgi:hypothetical protein